MSSGKESCATGARGAQANWPNLAFGGTCRALVVSGGWSGLPRRGRCRVRRTAGNRCSCLIVNQALLLPHLAASFVGAGAAPPTKERPNRGHFLLMDSDSWWNFSSFRVLFLILVTFHIRPQFYLLPVNPCSPCSSRRSTSRY